MTQQSEADDKGDDAAQDVAAPGLRASARAGLTSLAETRLTRDAP